MRNIKGWVCLARDSGNSCQFLFGKGINQEGYESLQTNGIVPFTSIREARAAQKLMRKRDDLERVGVADLRMEIAEKPYDISAIKTKRSFIAVMDAMKAEGCVQFFGRQVAGRPTVYPLPGAYLTDNCLQPFKDFESARFAASEIQRQAWCPTKIASFYLKRL